MASSTQLALPVPERNSMLAAMAFLTPVKDRGMECSCIYFPTCQVRVPRFYLSLCSSLCLPPSSFFLLPASSPAQRHRKLASSLGPGNAREKCQITDNGDGERDNMSDRMLDCQIGCQKLWQIKCPPCRMADRMSYSMFECMPDKMPEYLSKKVYNYRCVWHVYSSMVQGNLTRFLICG